MYGAAPLIYVFDKTTGVLTISGENIGAVEPIEIKASINWADGSSNTTLKKVDMSQAKKLVRIENESFMNCKDLQQIISPNSLTSIGNNVFYNCSGLQQLEFPESLTSIGDYAFYNCEGIQQLKFPEPLTSIGDYAFYNCRGLQQLEFADSLTSIGDYAFSNCGGIQQLELPDSLTSIGVYAFSQCTKLYRINCLTEKEPTMDATAFSSDYSIPNRILYAPNALDGFGNDSDNKWRAKRIVYGAAPLIYVFDKTTGVLTISGENIGAVESIEIKASINWADGSSNTTLKKVDMSQAKKLTTIGNNAFSNCSGLQQLKFPESLTSIGNDAFSYCSGLQQLELPKSLTTIGEKAFAYCYRLKALQCDAIIPPKLGGDVFYSVPQSSVTLSVPKGCISIYSSTDQWKKFGKIVGSEGFIQGDSNEDGEVDVSDVVNVVNYILYLNPKVFNFMASDVICDNEIDVFDVVGITGLILNPNHISSQSKAHYGVERTGTLHSSNGRLILNSTEPVVGFDFAYTGTLNAIIEGLKDFSITFYCTPEGEQRVIAYSMNEAIPTKATEIFACDDKTTVSDLKFVGINGARINIKSDIVSSTISEKYNKTTFSINKGILYIYPSEEKVDVGLYTLNGILVKKGLSNTISLLDLNRGIYVVKVITAKKEKFMFKINW